MNQPSLRKPKQNKGEKIDFAFSLIFSLLAIHLLAMPASASDYSDAVEFYEKKQYEKALPLFLKAEKSGVNKTLSAYYRALCYHQLNQVTEAISAYRRVVELYPQSRVADQARSLLAKIGPSGRKTTSKTSKRAPREKDEFVIHYKHWKDSDHIIVSATINNVATKMLFDTGAAVTLCRQSYLESEKIPMGKTSRTGRISGAGGEVDTRSGLAEIGVGDLKRTVPLVIQQDQSEARYGLNAFNKLPILGQNFYKDFTCEIDDSEKTITLHRIPPHQLSSVQGNSNKGNSNSINEVPFRREGNNIFVTAMVNGRECEMVFDTGAHSVVFSDRHLSRYGINRPVQATKTDAASAIGGKKAAYNFNLKRLQLGPIVKKNVPCTLAIHGNLSHPLLGQTFLKGLKYTIDPVHNLIRFDGGPQKFTF